MKMMVEWATRPAGTYEEDIANREAIIRAFTEWSPPEGLTIHAFVVKMETQAGFILIEFDDPAVVARWAAQFMPWNDARIVPVIDVDQVVPLYNDALAWTKSTARG
jgi:hypothetical protein